MDARQLEIFVKVAELGSFSKAAEALFLTQPTVSEHIRGLEEELGVRLLDRLGRGAAPTKAGQLLLGYGRRILELHREARQALDQFQGRMSGELVIAASTIPGEYVLRPLIGRLRGSGSRQALEKALAEVGLDLSDFRVVGEMGSTQAIKQGVKAGVGISLISKRAVAEECQAGTLHCVKVKDLRFRRAFYLVTSTTRSRSPLAEAFRAFLISESA